MAYNQNGFHSLSLHNYSKQHLITLLFYIYCAINNMGYNSLSINNIIKLVFCYR